MTRKNNEKRSFVFYDSFLEAMKHLDDTEFRECVMKIRDYALDGVDEQSDSPIVNVIMSLAKPNIEAARRRYEIAVENGKKGAEFGKLGGAPKGNQNARKKQPQKQPLDVDVNDNIDVNEDKNNNDYVNVYEETPSATKEFHSSFSNSSICLKGKIVNDSERLEEREEKKEPIQEVYLYQSNDCDVAPIDEEEEIISNSNFEGNLVTLGDPCIVEVEESAPSNPQSKEAGMDMGEYLEQCLIKNLQTLKDMRLGKIPQDDTVFWRAVSLYKDLYGNNDEKDIVKKITTIVTNAITNNF